MNNLSASFILGLAGGLAAFAHCLGMCGGFVVYLTRGGGFPHQFLWHAGRVFTYLLLAALAAYAGAAVATLLAGGGMQNLLSYAMAAVMAAAGMTLLGLMPVRGERNGGPFLRLAGELFTSASPGGALLLGVVAGILPCPIVVAFLAYCAQTASVPRGLVTMAGVGLGTSLPLLALGSTASAFSLKGRRWTARAAGVVLLALAVTTALRGTRLLHRLIPCPPVPQAIASETAAAQSSGNRHGN